MSENPNGGPGREDRLNEVLLRYVEAAQAGGAPDRGRLVVEYPDLRPELEEFFANRDALERLAGPLRMAARQGDAGAEAGVGFAPGSVTGGPWEGMPGGSPPDLGQLGDFRLWREVGRGGMGVVYEAEQLSLRRRVALKVLPFAAAIDRRQLQRFQNEALAAAHLRHEHIVPVFAVGSDRGVHYYAMQFVDGQSLAELIEDLRRSAGQTREPPAAAPPVPAPNEPTGPSAAPTAETRPPGPARTMAESVSRERGADRGRYFRWVAGLGRQTALALEHAHQAGIVHRDIKPANLLLDTRGELWVTDFGLARIGTDAGVTLTGELLGTLRYASPEQALARRGLVDHRSDLYSLGATLYELLALRPIFDGRDRHELLRQIAHDEPAPLWAADRAIPQELGTIILKAVAKEPGDRYATAQDLADDLGRFLEDLPIRARRPSLAEKATKWARRHRAVVGSALAALLVTVAGLAVATVLIARAYDRERRKAHEADVERAHAEDNFRLARQAVDRFARIGEEELAGRLASEPVRRRLLEVALAYYQDFLDQYADDPSTHEELEASRAKAERILGELATLMGAVRYFPLHLREVQDELGLSTDERAALDWLDKRWRDAMRQSFGEDPEKWERQRLALAREQEAEVARLLTPQQYGRFNQIAIQFAGVHAFSDPAVVKALGLTPEQKEQVRVLQGKTRLPGPMFRPPGRVPPKPPGRPEGARWRGVRKRMEEARAKVLALLTQEQKAKWEELIGKPFAVPAGALSPPRLPAR
jgi:serine/threonine protein kinase